VSLRRACRVVGISDSVYRYAPNANGNEALISALQATSERYPAYGFSKLLKVLRRMGHKWNHKRVHRVYVMV
jgi:putative transposase